MAIEVYTTDDDLVLVRPNILELGVNDWEDQHKEAFKIINRILVSRWYREVAAEYGYDWRETVFDPEKIDTDQIKRLSVYKTLELIYLYLMKDSPEPDGFERQHKLFRELFNEELSNLLSSGINYDWDADDTIDSDESYIPRQRRLERV